MYTKVLPAMAEDSVALQYAMVAFSALYSVKIHRPAEESAFDCF